MARVIKTEVIRELVNGFDTNYETTDDDGLHEMYDAMLAECCTCETCGAGGCGLKETDPIAYRCGFSDWLDSALQDEQLFEIDDEYFTPDQLDELKDELISAVEDCF